jgi:hypothetical protein
MLNAVVGYPGVVTTVILGVVLAYWLLVMLGALHIDVLGGHGLSDGAVDGAIHGAAKGVAEGLADGVAHGMAEGAAHGAAHGASHGASEGAGPAAESASGSAADRASVAEAGGQTSSGPSGGAGHVADLLSMANFRSVPVTVMLSVTGCFAWLFCVAGSRSVASVAGASPVPWWILGTLVLLFSFLLALVPTAIAIRPMSRFFVTHQATANAELVGKLCVVTTGRVDGKFGQAAFESDGMSLLIQVRADEGTELVKGKRALIVAWDRERQAFVVEPYEQVLNSR